MKLQPQKKPHCKKERSFIFRERWIRCFRMFPCLGISTSAISVDLQRPLGHCEFATIWLFQCGVAFLFASIAHVRKYKDASRLARAGLLISAATLCVRMYKLHAKYGFDVSRAFAPGTWRP